MARYCTKCGQELMENAKFCVGCGAKIESGQTQQHSAAQPTKKPTERRVEQATVQHTNQPNKQPTERHIEQPTAPPPQAKEPKKNKGFFAALRDELRRLLKHPKKLIPTFVLAVIWLVMPLVTGFAAGANIPIVRFFCTLTYANGGIFGGFFGTVGGIFGKAVFAAVVNGFVLSLCAKKNPFKGFKKGIGGVFGGGLKAISPLLSGAGAGLVLYWFFNITSAPQNSAVALVAAIAAIQAIGKQNGLLFGGAFYLLKKLSKGKAPARITVNRLMTGLIAGFSVGFGLTFLRYAWLIVLCGVILLGLGIGISFIGKNGMKKTVATAALFLMLGGLLLPLSMPVFAASDVPKGYKDPADLKNIKSAWTTGTPQIDGYYLEPIAVSSGRLKYDVLYKVVSEISDLNNTNLPPVEFTEDPFIISRKGDNGSYTISGGLHIDYNGDLGYNNDYYYEINYSFRMELSDIEFVNGENRFVAEVVGEETIDLVTNDPNMSNVSKTRSLGGTSEIGNVTMTVNEQDKGDVTITFSDPHDKYPDEVEITFRLLGYLPKGKSAPTGGTTGASDGEDGYIPYKGRLTYTSGMTNKHGQPFPDIMDFNNDGVIDYTDLAIRQVLVHNPDYLDTPEGALLIIGSLFTMVMGTTGGAIASVIGGSIGSGTSSALSGFDLNIEFPEDDGDEKNSASEMTPEEREYMDMVKQTDKYISTDSEGDLTVRDPVTGAEKHYIRQEDGSYRQLESGQSYTKDEIRNDLAHVERNAGYYSDVEKGRAEAAEYQREHASDLSEDGKKISEMMRQEKAEAERQDRLNEIGAKHGIYSGDEAEIREKMAKDQAFEEHMNERYHEVAENIDTVTKVAEYTKTAADIAADVVATADKTGVFKDVYSVTTAAAGNAGEVMAGNMTAAQAAAKTMVDASTEVLKNRAETTAGKIATNVLGDAAQDATAAIVEGKDLDEITDAGKKGMVRGLMDATVDCSLGSANELAGKDGGRALTEAGEAFTSDIIKTNLPEVDIPKNEPELPRRPIPKK